MKEHKFKKIIINILDEVVQKSSIYIKVPYRADPF